MENEEKYYLARGSDMKQRIVRGRPLMLSEGGDVTMRSCGYLTLSELRSSCKVLDEPCVECGGVVSANYTKQNQEIHATGCCFHCLFYRSCIGADRLIVSGAIYQDGGRVDPRTSAWVGHGGREFRIRTNDGRMISTNNLWHLCDVPEHFADRLPDNAQFLKVEIDE